MRYLSFASLAMLIIVGVAGLWWLAPPNSPITAKVIMSTVIYAPLALFLLATLKRDKRMLTWLCFILMFYFCGYVTQLLDPAPVATLAIAKVSLTSVLFILLMLDIRRPESPRD
ncbi:MAG: DUF2069 domain-containing protein [Alcanivoracaceae bacterium]|nr:DUF2069 domain-containing protein [Alcanivoracaceae bacterium]